jgi:hypothetical protein
VEDLMRHGFAQEDLSLLSTDTNIGRELYTDLRSKAPEGAVIGTVVGMILGGLIAALMHQGYVSDFGLGLLMMGRWPAILDGIALGSMIGLPIGALVGSLIPEYEVNLYRADQRHGGILLAVYTHARRVIEVTQLLEAAGGRRIAYKNMPDDVLAEPQRVMTSQVVK